MWKDEESIRGKNKDKNIKIKIKIKIKIDRFLPFRNESSNSLIARSVSQY